MIYLAINWVACLLFFHSMCAYGSEFPSHARPMLLRNFLSAMGSSQEIQEEGQGIDHHRSIPTNQILPSLMVFRQFITADKSILEKRDNTDSLLLVFLFKNNHQQAEKIAEECISLGNNLGRSGEKIPIKVKVTDDIFLKNLIMTQYLREFFLPNPLAMRKYSIL